MANKNDLRYIKTERLIVHTYVDMRMRDPSPVKVSDLCREALTRLGHSIRLESVPGQGTTAFVGLERDEREYE